MQLEMSKCVCLIVESLMTQLPLNCTRNVSFLEITPSTMHVQHHHYIHQPVHSVTQFYRLGAESGCRMCSGGIGLA